MDEKGIPSAVDDLVAEADETLAMEAGEETQDDGRLSLARRKELFRLFDEVRLRTFLAYPDPRSNFDALTMEAFTRAFLELAAGESDEEVYEKVMDNATQLAADDREYFASRRGFPAVHIPSLVDLFGFKAGEEFHTWLTVVDSIEMPARAVYHLRDVFGMTNKEASELLGCSEGWTSKLYSRAEIHLTSAGVPVEELKECFFNIEIKRR
ncbi:hypothetical protein [Streptomyces sp. NPDC050564]|uniref:hypothetical protein n=1 Tax=Streptomyces sp. NPDC050564 TaxID=3365631 RepID=UPI0037BD0C67